LAYLAKVIDIFSKIPFTSLKLENVNWIILVVFLFDFNNYHLATTGGAEIKVSKVLKMI